MFKGPAQQTRDKIKKRYGKSLAEMKQGDQSSRKVSKKKRWKQNFAQVGALILTTYSFNDQF